MDYKTSRTIGSVLFVLGSGFVYLFGLATHRVSTGWQIFVIGWLTFWTLAFWALSGEEGCEEAERRVYWIAARVGAFESVLALARFLRPGGPPFPWSLPDASDSLAMRIVPWVVLAVCVVLLAVLLIKRRRGNAEAAARVPGEAEPGDGGQIPERQGAVFQGEGQYFRTPRVDVLGEGRGRLVLGKPLWDAMAPGFLLIAVGWTLVSLSPGFTLAHGWFIIHILGVLSLVAGVPIVLLHRRVRVEAASPAVTFRRYIGFVPLLSETYTRDQIRAIKLDSEKREDPLWARGRDEQGRNTLHREFCSYVAAKDGGSRELSRSSDYAHERAICDKVARYLEVPFDEAVAERALREVGSNGHRMLKTLMLTLLSAAFLVGGLLLRASR